VNAIARSELCCIPFEIKGVPGVALVDSGSQVSMISKQFMDQLANVEVVQSPLHFGGIGSKGFCAESAIIPVKIGSQLVEVKAYVNPNMDIHANLLIGRNVNSTRIIDGVRHCVTIKDQSVDMISERQMVEPCKRLIEEFGDVFSEPTTSKLDPVVLEMHMQYSGPFRLAGRVYEQSSLFVE
jgi:hypothetical protein